MNGRRDTANLGPPSTFGSTYRVDRPTMGILLRDLWIPRHHPGPGDTVPAFDLPTTAGGTFSNATVAARGRPVVLVFGSLTCPVTESAGPSLVALHRRYGDAVDFVVVNVREAHPGTGFPQPPCSDEKMVHARALATHHGFEFPVAVDDIDGSMHRAFGTRPSSAYVIDATGKILFRAHWSNSASALGDAVKAVHGGGPPPRATSGRTLRALANMAGYSDVPLQTAGAGAMRDFWVAAPPVALLLTVSRAFSWLPAERRAVPSVALLACSALALGGTVAKVLG